MKTVYYNGYNWYNCDDRLLFLFSFTSVETIASWTNPKVQEDWLYSEWWNEFYMWNILSCTQNVWVGSSLIILVTYNKSVYISQVNLFSFYGIIKKMHCTEGEGKKKKTFVYKSLRRERIKMAEWENTPPHTDTSKIHTYVELETVRKVLYNQSCEIHT